ncbi:MAG TPA: ADOP family duplicated permease [Bryobacteraceae bacterium]|jgi:predicted permease
MQPWKLAVRPLRKRPFFSIAVAGLLALGIGANTALFSVVNTVVLRPLPYPDAAQLVLLLEASPAKSQKESLIAPVLLEDWNRLSRTFTAISGSYSDSLTDTSGSEPERLGGLRVAPRYFQVYGVAPVIGRTFSPVEERFGGPQSAVISYGLWARRFALDPRITTRRLVFGGQGYSIVGVMPPNFAAPSIEVWLPAQVPPFLLRQRAARYFSGVGRMKPGVTLAQARADLDSVQHALGEQFPATDKGWSAAIRDLKAARLGDAARPLTLLFAAVGMLLLITLTNLAGLVIAQLHQRERELAIRASIGATRAQAIGGILLEVGVLTSAGAAAGWTAAYASLPLVRLIFADVPRIFELSMDWRAPAFAVAAGFLALAVCGFLPAWRATGSEYCATAWRAGRGIAGARQRTLRVLVAAQIGVTMALVAGAALLVRSFYNLDRADLGIDARRTFLFRVGAAWDEDRNRIGHMQEQLLAELRRLPGVEAAGITNFLPASGATLRYQAALEGAATTEDEGRMPAGERFVSPGYLQALRAPLLAGTWCPELRLDFQSPPKAMVNRRFVDVYAHGANVVGRHVLMLDLGNPPPSWEIVGVVGDIKEDAVSAPPYPYVYWCAMGGYWPDPEYVVRARGDMTGIISAVRQLVRQIAPTRAVFEMRSLEDAFAQDLDRPRSNARLLTLFAAAALLLASVGLYGLMTQTLNARRQEIGIRIAIGAAPARIVGSMLAGAGALVAIGIAAGILLVLVARPALRSLVFGIGSADALTLAAGALALSAAALLASLGPSLRAARVDPIEALRAE